MPVKIENKTEPKYTPSTVLTHACPWSDFSETARVFSM